MAVQHVTSHSLHRNTALLAVEDASNTDQACANNAVSISSGSHYILDAEAALNGLRRRLSTGRDYATMDEREDPKPILQVTSDGARLRITPMLLGYRVPHGLH